MLSSINSANPFDPRSQAQKTAFANSDQSLNTMTYTNPPSSNSNPVRSGKMPVPSPIGIPKPPHTFSNPVRSQTSFRTANPVRSPSGIQVPPPTSFGAANPVRSPSGFSEPISHSSPYIFPHVTNPFVPSSPSASFPDDYDYSVNADSPTLILRNPKTQTVNRIRSIVFSILFGGLFGGLVGAILLPHPLSILSGAVLGGVIGGFIATRI